jgi:cold shock CspA family protein
MKELGTFKGEVIKYFVEKKFGFIKIKEYLNNTEWTKVFPRVIGEDAFIHFSDIEPDKVSHKKLMSGQVVEFTVIRGQKGLTAKNLKIVGSIFDKEGEANGNV